MPFATAWAVMQAAVFVGYRLSQVSDSLYQKRHRREYIGGGYSTLLRTHFLDKLLNLFNIKNGINEKIIIPAINRRIKSAVFRRVNSQPFAGVIRGGPDKQKVITGDLDGYLGFRLWCHTPPLSFVSL